LHVGGHVFAAGDTDDLAKVLHRDFVLAADVDAPQECDVGGGGHARESRAQPEGTFPPCQASGPVMEAIEAIPPGAAPAPAVVAVRSDFEAFYRAEWAGAARLAFLLLGSEARAEEVAQDAFVAVHQRWDAIEHPAAYLRSAIVNRTRDRFRRQARWNEREHL